MNKLKNKCFKVICYISLAFLCANILNIVFKNIGNSFKEILNKKDENKYENQNNVKEDIVIPLMVEKYNYDLINEVKLLHIKDNTVENILLDEYIVNVVAAEMPVEYELEALKAQAIVARTYTLYKITNESKHENADICDNYACCQAWISREDRFSKWEDNKQEKWNKLVRAVNETKGKYITYQGKVINAFFHSNSSGKTEKPEDVWGGALPYLDVVETLGEENYESYKSEVRLSKKEFENIFKENYQNFKIDFSKKDAIKILEYTDSNRVKKIKIGNMYFSGVDIRKILSLKSTNFNIDVLENEVVLYVLGYGHGVGLSQTGSDALAKNNYTADEIIKHFYKNIEIHE